MASWAVVGPTYQQSHSASAVASLGQQRTTAFEGRCRPASGGRLARPLRTSVTGSEFASTVLRGATSFRCGKDFLVLLLWCCERNEGRLLLLV